MIERHECDAVVIGAGIVGLGVARALALAGAETLIIERNTQVAMETSTRNSEVVHAGIYYPTGSLKARLCVAGREQLYTFCRERGIRAPKIGKLIVATSGDQEPALGAIADQARANGVHDLRFLSVREAKALEPDVSCRAALFSPTTGIVDSRQFALALLGDAQAAGAHLAVRTEALSVTPRDDQRLEIRLRSNGAEHLLLARRVVNAAGLWSGEIARQTSGLSPQHRPTLHFARGRYLRLAGRSPFSHLIYPVPEPGGLGIHVTLDLGGQARFGPDVEWLATRDPSAVAYDVDPALAEVFARAIRAYWPCVTPERLVPDYAGVRPKLSGPG
jgi:L-2-hydroxyglutarate oxidase LhgO